MKAKTAMLLPDETTPLPEYRGKLQKTDENRKDRESILRHALNTFGFLVPANIPFRISFLGQEIKKYSTDPRSQFIGDICLVNGYYVCPFIKNPDGSIQQIQ